MPRHIFTPEERARGHKLTREDRQRGGRNVPKAKRGGEPRPEHIAKLIELGAKYRITPANARAMAARSAQVRRERRAAALLRLELDKKLTGIYLGGQERVELTMAEVGRMGSQPARRGSRDSEPRQGEPDDVAIIDGQMMVGEIKSASDAYALGASLAGKLMEAPPITAKTIRAAGDAALAAHGRESADMRLPQVVVDAFTLSALKRFRLGKMNPLQLTRSQRAHMSVMAGAGYVTGTADGYYELTEKGRRAVQEAEDTGPDGEASDLHYPNGGSY